MHNSTDKWSMKKERVMPLGLQKYTLKKMFKKLNPDADPEFLDWDCMSYDQNFNENYRDMENGNPEYVWFEQTLFEIEDLSLIHI